LAPDVDKRDIIKEVENRRAVAEQQASQIVDEAIRRAGRLVQTNPDDARDLIRRTQDGVRNNPDISERARVAMSERLERALQTTDRIGVRVKDEQVRALELKAIADARLARERADRTADDRIRARMVEFHNLMDRAREDVAYRVALSIREDLIRDGRQ